MSRAKCKSIEQVAKRIVNECGVKVSTGVLKTLAVYTLERADGATTRIRCPIRMGNHRTEENVIAKARRWAKGHN